MSTDWPLEIYNKFKEVGVRQVSYVPDAGHTKLINAVIADPEIHAVSLTSEEEGVALATGAWLGGDKSVLLMQSSGVGNCVNMLSLIKSCKIPFLTLVTMRGEWGEFNPWQVPMGSTTQTSFEMMGIHVMRIEDPKDVTPVLTATTRMVFEGGTPVAILLSQRLIGAKVFEGAR